jgi:hypothetical protein
MAWRDNLHFARVIRGHPNQRTTVVSSHCVGIKPTLSSDYGKRPTLARLGTGCIALLLMLAAEFGLVLRIRGISVRQYLATRDHVSGAAYYLMLIVFAVMPLLIRKP